MLMIGHVLPPVERLRPIFTSGIHSVNDIADVCTRPEDVRIVVRFRHCSRSCFVRTVMRSGLPVGRKDGATQTVEGTTGESASQRVCFCTFPPLFRETLDGHSG